MGLLLTRPGILVPAAVAKDYVLIDRTAGTNIGNITAQGGLAGCFNGTTSEHHNSAARKNSTTSYYIGKTLASSMIFAKAKIYGSNSRGFDYNNNSMTVNIRGKTGSAPTGPTDGTIIGTVTFTDTSNESAGREIESTDKSTYWDHIFAQVIDNGSQSGSMYCAELELWQWA